eukprot:1787769-Pleurochrysis_carterae.AAC.1
MEDKRDRVSLRFVRSEKQFLRLTSKAQFKNVIEGVGNESFRILNMSNPSVYLNKPIYCGSAILDYSKTKMYDFYYNTMQPRYGSENLSLVLTDTDSFVFAIKTQDWYKDMAEMKHHFDTSNYPKDHPLYSSKRKKQL